MDGQSNLNEDDGNDKSFEEHVVAGISQECIDEINKIKNNDPNFRAFSLHPGEAERFFTEPAWELLGRYIANNDHLEHIDLRNAHLTDMKISLLFRHWTMSGSLKNLDLSVNSFGPSGIQSMAPFLKNAPNLTHLDIGQNMNLDSECFRLVIDALHGGSIKELRSEECDIDDISALGHCTLPHLQLLYLDDNRIRTVPSLEKYTNLWRLWLRRNNIGTESCKSIAKLMQRESSSLRELDLNSNDIGDEGAEILANSLKFNTTLTEIMLGNNKFKEKGHHAFLKLLKDVSSIKATYNSNHTLTALYLPYFPTSNFQLLRNHMTTATIANQNSNSQRNPHAAGRDKVIETQLNSQTRKELCYLQGIDYTYSSIFAEIEPILLPNLLALTAEHHGRTELFRTLVATAPDLTCLIDRESMLKVEIAKHSHRRTVLSLEFARQAAEFFDQRWALSEKMQDLERRLESMGGSSSVVVVKSYQSSPPLIEKELEKTMSTTATRGRKRPRSASF